MNYFLCSKAVVEQFKPQEVSKPFKSGYEFEKEEEYFVAQLDYAKVRRYYKEHVEPVEKETIFDGNYFWAREVVPGTMDISKITLKGIRENGLFLELERIVGLTTERNRAMCIFNLTEKFGCKNPIEFINKIAS